MVPLQTPSALARALFYFRSKAGLSRKKLATLLSIADPSLLTRYEKGKKPLSREQLKELLGPTGFGSEEIDLFLVADDLISATEYTDTSPVALRSQELRRIDRAVLAAVSLGAEALRAELIRRKRTEKVRLAREEAEKLWELLIQNPSENRRFLITIFPEYRQWGLAEKLCHESERAAAHEAETALVLADLALFVALRVPGDEAWCSELQGYCWLFIGNARRVANKLDEAHEAFDKARELLKKTGGGSGVLDLSRRLDLEASLRRDQQRYPEALALLDESLSMNQDKGDEVVARLLLKKEHVFERMGDHEGALSLLREATPYVERSGSRQLRFALHFNTADNLLHLERFDEAAGILDTIQELADEEGSRLNLIRVLWLRARIAAGQGRDEEAMASLETVEREFTGRRLPYDAALASLDRAVLLLRHGRTAEVRGLALSMGWIFGAVGIDREALASLSLFCEAAHRGSATSELAREVIDRIEDRRRSAPQLLLRGKGRA
jgi:tetratricopeptide (TPR) repeat protein